MHLSCGDAAVSPSCFSPLLWAPWEYQLSTLASVPAGYPGLCKCQSLLLSDTLALDKMGNEGCEYVLCPVTLFLCTDSLRCLGGDEAAEQPADGVGLLMTDSTARQLEVK